MSLISAGDLVESLAFLHDAIPWIKCPFCDDEVSKLRPCVYYEHAREVKTHICVECAESVKGLTYLAARHTIPGVDVIPELKEPYKFPTDPKYINEKSYRAQVVLGSWIFWVWPEANHILVLENNKPAETIRKYDNTFQAWFALKAQFEKGQDVEVENKFKKGWGKKKNSKLSLFQ